MDDILETVIDIISFDGKLLNVYGTFDNPLIKAVDLAKAIDYSNGNVSKMMKLVSETNKILGRTKSTSQNGGNKNVIWMLTEQGMSEVLLRSSKPVAEGLMKVATVQLAELRKLRGEALSAFIDYASSQVIESETNQITNVAEQAAVQLALDYTPRGLRTWHKVAIATGIVVVIGGVTYLVWRRHKRIKNEAEAEVKR